MFSLCSETLPSEDGYNCVHCKKFVLGGINACAYCGWSVHLIGDLGRRSDCRGPMRPSKIRLRREGNYLKLRADFICEKCGQSREGGIVGYRVKISGKEKFLQETSGLEDPPMIRSFIRA